MFNTDHLSNFDLSMIHWIAITTFLGIALAIVVIIFQLIVIIFASNRRARSLKLYGRR